MSQPVSALIAIYASMLAMDVVWLTTMKPFYAKYIGHLMASSVNYTVAGVFYVLYGVGILVFVVQPLIKSNGSLAQAFVMGAFLGLIAYAAYDLTNHATLKDWKLMMTVVDMAWGAFITGMASMIGLASARYF